METMAVVSMFADGRIIRHPNKESVSNASRLMIVQKRIDRLVQSEAHKEFHSWDMRRKLVSSVCWFLMASEHLDALAEQLKGKRVLEIAAGTGYLAAQMRLRGHSKYRAIDGRCSYFDIKSINFGTEIVDFYSLPIEELQSYDVILMTWPPYDSELAYHVFRKMRKGQVLFYLGEFWGCTGSDRFHQALELHCEALPDPLDDTPQWAGIRDRWFAYKKLRNYSRSAKNEQF